VSRNAFPFHTIHAPHVFGSISLIFDQSLSLAFGGKVRPCGPL
jgi:hypothetical protein